MNKIQINELLVAKLKSGDKIAASALRMIKSEIGRKELTLKVGEEISQKGIDAIIRAYFDTVTQEAEFTKNFTELEFMKTILPAETKKKDEAETRMLVERVMSEMIGLIDGNYKGRAMKILKCDPTVDMALAAKIINEYMQTE